MISAIVILAIVAIAGVGLAWNESARMQDLQTAMGGQIKTAQQDYDRRSPRLEQKQAQADAATTALQSDLGVVTKRLRLTQGELKTARDEAAQIRDDAQKQIADVSTNVSDVKTELSTKASADDLNATNGNVTAVKTDLGRDQERPADGPQRTGHSDRQATTMRSIPCAAWASATTSSSASGPQQATEGRQRHGRTEGREPQEESVQRGSDGRRRAHGKGQPHRERTDHLLPPAAATRQMNSW